MIYIIERSTCQAFWQLSAPHEKFLLVPDRKFLLTGWKDGQGTNGTDTTRKRLVGLAKASHRGAETQEKF
jgi:hypothetical protein